MKVKMLKNRQGSPDGILVNNYIRGETVEMPYQLAHVFIRQHWAQKLADPALKDGGRAPENKKFTEAKNLNGKLKWL